MSDKKPEGLQIPAIIPFAPYVQESFDLNRLDAFVKSLGSTFYHWKSTPSPIGLNDRGDYRRNNNVDVITSNGYLYSFGGKFTATMTGNQKDQRRPTEGALIDASSSYLVLPRFYDEKPSAPTNGDDNKDCCNDLGSAVQKRRIRLAVGDRLYSDPTIDDLVVNKELMNFSYNSPNVPMFPIVEMDAPITDSRGVSYTQGIDYNIDCDGNISWIVGGSNPGIDPDTGAGRSYTIRYLYRAFYYVTSILREVRITEITEGSVRRPERMPMYVQLTREYIYHNINRGNELNKPPQQGAESRQVPQAPETINTPNGMVRVETTDLDNDE